jgi:hypothetical protein
MKRRHTEGPSIEKRPLAGSRPGQRHVVAASAFLTACLSSIVVIGLYRAPMPVDAFAALGAQIAGVASDIGAN